MTARRYSGPSAKEYQHRTEMAISVPGGLASRSCRCSGDPEWLKKCCAHGLVWNGERWVPCPSCQGYVKGP